MTIKQINLEITRSRRNEELNESMRYAFWPNTTV